MTKLEAVEQARQLIAQAYQVLVHSGFDHAYALEKLQALVLEVWTQTFHAGLVPHGSGLIGKLFCS